MEQKINIAELLKDCPQGMELDCTMFENLEFDRIEKDDGSGKYYIICRVKTKIGYNIHTFTEHGCYSSNNYAKCVIFPKGKTTWEEFHRPFKDGDILVYKDKYKVKYTFIYKRRIDMHYLLQYCGWFSKKPYFSEQFNTKERMPLYENDDIKFATEEEKEKLFQAIKDNGYNWNPETKTLEELVKPKFKVGDWVTDGINKCQISFIDNTHYWYSEKCILGSIESVDKQYHLWTIEDAKDGDVIFYDDGWTCIFKCIHGIWYSSYCFMTYDGEFHMGYEEHTVDAKINGNSHPATKEQCNFLFQKIKEAGYNWNPETKTLEKLIEPKFKVGDVIQDIDSYKVKITEVNIEDECYGYESVISKGIGIGGMPFSEQNEWELVPNKFDITKLKPFKSEVLIRNTKIQKWVPAFWGYKTDEGYVTTFGTCIYCIPYEGNENLLNTNNDCIDYYKTWE